MSGCQTCGGFGNRHDSIAHDAEVPRIETCEHEWMQFGGPGDEWQECFLCGLQEDW